MGLTVGKGLDPSAKDFHKLYYLMVGNNLRVVPQKFLPTFKTQAVGYFC